MQARHIARETATFNRLREKRKSADSAPLLEPPGFLPLNYGRATPTVTILAHIGYGATVGVFARGRRVTSSPIAAPHPGEREVPMGILDDLLGGLTGQAVGVVPSRRGRRSRHEPGIGGTDASGAPDAV